MTNLQTWIMLGSIGLNGVLLGWHRRGREPRPQPGHRAHITFYDGAALDPDGAHDKLSDFMARQAPTC
jgi:hypothetical protein